MAPGSFPGVGVAPVGTGRLGKRMLASRWPLGDHWRPPTALPCPDGGARYQRRPAYPLLRGATVSVRHPGVERAGLYKAIRLAVYVAVHAFKALSKPSLAECDLSAGQMLHQFGLALC